MQRLKELFENRRILIAGFGREGRSSYRTIRRLLPNQQLGIADKNADLACDESLKNDPHISLHLGPEYLTQAGQYDLILKSPGIPTFDFEGIVTNLSTISSQTDVFLQLFGHQTVGITGTKGKSTTTNLIYNVLSAHNPNVIMAGNMGIPLFDIINQINDSTTVVIELSSHQLENVHTSPHIAVLLNLFQEHLDHYHSYEDYQLAKMNIAKFQSEKDIFIYCKDNELINNNLATVSPKSILLPYSLRRLDNGCCPENEWLTIKPYGTRIYNTSSERHLLGNHNLLNIMATFLTAHCHGIPDEQTAYVVNHFKGLEHRMEFVVEKNGIRFYNDSISTIPEACIAASEALKNVDTLILGGFDRGIDYTELAHYLEKSRIHNLVFVGKAGNRIAQLLDKQSLETRNTLFSNSYPEIIDWCFGHTAQGKICLLSPAASSYDQFKNFEERGRAFKNLILEHQ
ncbi:MAG: UDP-N-acetylmuramoyl-L-alanine--D-glutamate ligase [Bacteroidales bacterium]|nr:UDP-N-acetylmuramoyl-L-alanine--D-glutamate ligase [Bacteroidales bacterium]